MTRPRFVKAIPADGELSRWDVVVGGLHDQPIGAVVSRRWGQASAYWLAYPDGDPQRMLRHEDAPNRPPWVFITRKEAGDALALHRQQPELGPGDAWPPAKGTP